jgi:chemotaxis protein histidine kinase CheA
MQAGLPLDETIFYEGRSMQEKMIEEEDLKGLEKEIDAAVDRLFVEKGGKPLKSPSADPPFSEVFQETKEVIEWETAPSVALAPEPSRPMERLETQLLSLEWEISRENLKKTVEEVLNLRKEFGEAQDISTLLNRMVSVLNLMIQNEEAIQPHLIRFLLDSKETIQLLLKKEAEEDIITYKKLAYAGIEARFSCLKELQEAKPKPAPIEIDMPNREKGPSLIEPEFSGEIARRMETFSECLNQLVEKIDRHLSAHEKLAKGPEIEHPEHESPLKSRITIFKTGERVFGVESDKVIKLFRVPSSLSKQVVQLKKFRLKELTVRMIDLKDFFSISGEDHGEEKQILILKGDEEYKGVMMDRVLNRLSGPLEQAGEFNEYLLGMVRWTYDDLPIKVPILDFKKL